MGHCICSIRMLEADPAMKAALDEVLRRARLVHPDVAEDRFLAHVAARLRPGTPVVAQLEALHVEDLALAWACVEGAPPAIERLLREHASVLRAATEPHDPAADDVAQTIRERLLGIGGPAKLLDYAGRGPLAAWLRVTARRIAIDLARTRNRHAQRVVAHDDALAAEVADEDVELHFMKEAYREAFDDALAQALASLTPRQRSVLRHRLVQDVQIQDIARIYDVNRKTITRWIAEARAAVFDAVRRTLGERLALGEAEFESLLRVVRSRLGAGITGALRLEGDSGVP